MTAPWLSASDLVLRPLEAADAEAIVDYASSAGFFEFVPEAPEPLRSNYTKQDALDFVAAAQEAWRAGWPTWGIEHQGRLVGTVRIHPVGWHDGGAAGYGLHPDLRGRGLATAALKTVLAWCQKEGRASPAARCDPDNVASRHVLERCGFRSSDGRIWKT